MAEILLLEQYLKVQEQLETLQAKREALRATLLESLPREGAHYSGHSFIRAVRTTYTHTAAVRTQEKALKAAKQFEISQGLAVVDKATEYLMVRRLGR